MENCESNESNEIKETIESIETIIKEYDLLILKFDEENSKYNEFFEKINNEINCKTTNITDKDIIEFYDIETLPSIYVYRNKNLLGTIEGYHTKSSLLKQIKALS